MIVSRWVLGALFGTALWAARAVNPDAAAVADFKSGVSEYMKIHKQAESSLPKLKSASSAEAIAAHVRALADRIRQARPGARQGDLFTPGATAEFRRLIGMAMEGRKAARVHQSLRSGEPVRFRLEVNGQYPEAVPRQSAPPTLLQNLPVLPEELRYAIVDHALAILDAPARLVVDFLPDAIP